MAHTGKRGPSNELDGGKVRKRRITSAVTELLNCETALNNTSGDEKRRDGQKVLRNTVYSKKSLSCEAGPAARSAFLNKEKNIYLVNKLRKSGDDCSGHREIPVADKSEGEFVLTHTTELESMKRLDDQKGKRKGIDSNLMQQCYIVLKKLMNHPSGWAFNQPVDPVKLHIPDYFSIISKPMDLGTIKHKLEKKQYSDIQNFVADVRLTFSNAMLYNPPGNDVHIMASKLNNYFEMLWKSLEANLSLGSSKVGPKANTNERLKDTRNLKRDNLKESDSCLNILPRTSMPSAQRQKMRKDLMEISEGKIPSDFLDRLRRIGLIGQNEEKIQVDFSTCDDRKLSEWYKAIKPYLDSRSIKSVPVKNCSQLSSSKKDLCGETGTQVRKACSKFIVRQTSTPARFGGPCTPGEGFNASPGWVSNCINSKHETRGLRTASCSSYVRDPVGKGTVCQRVSKSGPDFTGAVSTSDEKVQHGSSPVTPTTAAACLEGWEATLNDLHMSPTKAHRAAMLKKRFANTIMRAQTNTLLCNGEKRDPVRMQQEKEILRKLQKEAQIRAAAEAKLKMQREREREEARITLLKMEKTVEIYEDEEILKEIEELGYPRVCGGRIRNPLERLGLFLKTDYIEEEQEVEKEEPVKDLTGELEEGEFVS